MNGIIVIAISIAFLYVSFNFRHRVNKIAKNGLEVEGIVYDFIAGDNNQSNTKYPIIRFVTSKKEWITETYGIGSILGSFKKGQVVTVVYNPDNPKEFFVKSAITSYAISTAMILGIIMFAFGICTLLHIKF
jgi:sugar-specific transcriptional regulator TrmB